MASTHGYGVFLRLPYELREQIWLDFIPVGRAQITTTVAQTSAEADLRVLCASRDLYTEISTIIYSKSYLHFDLSLSYPESPRLWSLVSFRRHSNRKKKDNNNNSTIGPENAAVWRLESDPLQKSARFDNFPFHKVSSIEIHLPAPHPEAATQYLWLWRKVIRTAELFRDAKVPAFLTIKLEKGLKWDWYHKNDICVIEKKNTYDAFILPFFYAARDLRGITVQPHSEELRNKMDWGQINWAQTVFADRTAQGNQLERKLRLRVIDDYFWMHEQLFRSLHFRDDGTIDEMRDEWICETFMSALQPHVDVKS